MQKIIRIIPLIIILFFVFLNSLVFIWLGVDRSIHAYMIIAHDDLEGRPGVYIMESLDSFLIAIVFLVFALGLAKLFVPNAPLLKSFGLPWLKIEDFSD